MSMSSTIAKMTIGELAEVTGASARSLRHYEAEGLLASSRLPSGYRDFNPATIETVRQIRLLLSLGFSIKVIRELAPCFPESAEAIAVCPKVRSALLRHRSNLKARYAELASLIRKIDSIVNFSTD